MNIPFYTKNEIIKYIRRMADPRGLTMILTNRMLIIPPVPIHMSGAIIARLVSAYFYCKTNEHDALCGSEALNPDTVDLKTFARHWSNFGLRQLALAYVQPDAVMTSGFISARYSYSDHPGWFLLKRYLDGPNRPGGRR